MHIKYATGQEKLPGDEPMLFREDVAQEDAAKARNYGSRWRCRCGGASFELFEDNYCTAALCTSCGAHQVVNWG